MMTIRPAYDDVNQGFVFDGTADSLLKAFSQIETALRAQQVAVVKTAEVIEKMSQESGKDVKSLEIKFEGFADSGRKLTGVIDAVQNEAGQLQLSLNRVTQSFTDLNHHTDEAIRKQEQLKQKLLEAQNLRNAQSKTNKELNTFWQAMNELVEKNTKVLRENNAQQARSQQQTVFDRLKREDLEMKMALINAEIKLRQEEARTRAERLAAGAKMSAQAIVRGSIGPNPLTAAENIAASHASDKLRDLFENMGGRQIADLFSSTTAKMASTKFVQMNELEQKMATVLKGVRELGVEVAKTDKELVRFNLSMVNFAKFFVIHIAYTAFFKLSQAIKEGLKNAVELEKKLAEIQTISQGNPLTGGTQSLLNISSATGFSAQDVAKTTYDIISNQIANGDQALQFMKQVGEFARVTNTSLADAGNNLANVLNSYGRGIGATTEISSQLFKIIELGRVTGGDLADTFGRVLAPAAQMGIEFAEIGALMELLTIKGIRGSEAITQVNALINSAISPTEKWQAQLEKLGFSTAQEAINVLKLSGYLKLMIDQIKAGNISLGDTLSNVRARRPLQALMADDNFPQLLSNLEKTKDALGSYTKAVQMVTDIDAVKFEKHGQAIKNFFINIGEGLKTISVKGLDFVVEVTDPNKWKVGATTDQIISQVEKAAKSTDLTQSLILQNFTKKLEERSKAANEYLTAIRIKNVAVMSDLEKAGVKLTRSLKISFESMFTDLNNQLGLLEANSRRLLALSAKTKESQLDTTLANKNPIEQVQLLKKTFESLRTEGLTLFNKGNLEEGTAKLEEAQTVLEKMFTLRDKLVSERATNLETPKSDRTAQLSTLISQQEEALKQLDYTQFFNVVYNAQHAQLKQTSDLVKLQNAFIEEQLKANQRRVDLIGGRSGSTIPGAKISVEERRDAAQNFVRDLEKFKITDDSGAFKGVAKIQAELNELVGVARALNVPLTLIYDIQGKILERSRLFDTNQSLSIKNILNKSGTKEAVKELQEAADQITEAKTRIAKDYGDIVKNADAVKMPLSGSFKTYGQQPEKLFGLNISETLSQITSETSQFKLLYLLEKVTQVQNEVSKLQSGSGQIAYVESVKALADLIEAKIAISQAQNRFLRESQFQGLELSQQKGFDEVTKIKELGASAIGISLLVKNNFNEMESDMLNLFDAYPDMLNMVRAGGVALQDQLKVAHKEMLKMEATAGRIQRLQLINLGTPSYGFPGSTNDVDVLGDFGGYSFASGGKAGIDSIHAMLSPGEFVMNPSSSSRFYTQLMSMNAGFMGSKGFAAGGSTTSIGDINVSVNESNSPTQTARQIGTEIRRELNRGRLTLSR